MVLTEVIKSVLIKNSVEYTELDGTVQMTLLNGSHKWQTAVTADSEGFMRYYARYPWRVPAQALGRVLEGLNGLNEHLRDGCFMVSGEYVLFRCSAYIFDPFVAEESAEDLFLTSAAQTDAAWGSVYSLIFND